jgi:Flp pilus assembly protein TadG
MRYIVRRAAIFLFTTVLGARKDCFFSGLLPAGLRDLCDDQQGTIAVIGGLSATVLFGFAALALDVTSWQAAQHSMQGAADTAAYSAGIAYAKNDGTSYVTQAKAIAAGQRYVDGQNGTTVTVNRPPSSGSYTSNTSAIEVIVQQPQPRFLSGLFLATNPIVNARAVIIVSSTGPACILALDPTANQAITVSGSANVNSPGCDIVANSSSANAINMSGSSRLTTPCLVAVGGVTVTSGLALTECSTPTTGASVTSDPYASVPTPTPSGPCLTVPNTQTVSLSAGYYCSGLHISGSQTATFGPGVYYISGGDFKIDGSASGTGVTFYTTAGNTVSINGSNTTTFSAPTGGTYSGIVFFGDRAGNTSTNNTINGGSNTQITGVAYFPTENLTFAGGAASASNCTQLVADTIKITGNSYFSTGCTGDGMANINTSDGRPGLVQLVE